MGYYVNLETPLQKIPEKFNSWIEKEICSDGLLEEIDRCCLTFRTGQPVESYEIWIKKEDWTINDDETSSIGDTQTTINYPFQVAIIVAQTDDEEASENKAIQLQSKTIMSIFKNYIRGITDDGSCYINYFKLNEGYNDGTLKAINQEDVVIIKGFRITFNITIDWLRCMQKINE